MALEALTSNELLNFIIYETISAMPPPYSSHESPETTTTVLPEDAVNPIKTQPEELLNGGGAGGGSLNSPSPSIVQQHCSGGGSKPGSRKANLAVQGRKKRRRRPRVCKNKEEAETQRMTHIAVERNRRKQMNEHLAVLRSLMPESYVQRGDQASIVGGAIEFVKELEHLLQSLEAQKLQLLQRSVGVTDEVEEQEQQEDMMMNPDTNTSTSTSTSKFLRPPFSQFFVYPQYTWSQIPNNKYTSTSSAAIADIEVTLIETHANLRILCRRSPRVRQLSRLVAGFHTLHLSILHLNVTTMDALVLCSISAKVEEGCQLTTVDDIAGAVHHMLRIIEEGEGALI